MTASVVCLANRPLEQFPAKPLTTTFGGNTDAFDLGAPPTPHTKPLVVRARQPGNPGAQLVLVAAGLAAHGRATDLRPF